MHGYELSGCLTSETNDVTRTTAHVYPGLWYLPLMFINCSMSTINLGYQFVSGRTGITSKEMTEREEHP